MTKRILFFLAFLVIRVCSINALVYPCITKTITMGVGQTTMSYNGTQKAVPLAYFILTRNAYFE